MPGRLRTTFRSGNLAEHLGLLLLKGIAAVAEVSRPEDIGLDAIATLLRRDEDGNCYAEDTFVVQIKAASTASICYKDHELSWLMDQRQPMFLALVSLPDARISLYTTVFINQAIASLHPKALTIRFGPSSVSGVFRDQRWAPWTNGGDDETTVWLGPPIIEWSLKDIVDAQWAESAYQSLKLFIGVLRDELVKIACGECSVLKWTTNDATSFRSCPGMIKGNPKAFASLALQSAPYMKAMMLHVSSSRDRAGVSVLQALLVLMDALRDFGVDVDPDNSSKIYKAIAKGHALDRGSL